MLEETNVVLGVTGSIAAVRCVELIHELQRHGASVRVVMSDAATRIVHPDALTYAADAAAITRLTGDIEHITLCGNEGWGDVFVIAPATANSIGKVTAGIDDTPVTTCATTAIGAGMPVVIAPAMHAAMYDHAIVQDNQSTLAELGIDLVPPRLVEGKAKIATNESIVLSIARAIRNEQLADRHIVVSSGATAETIDPIRILTTRASGRMGRAMAKWLFVHGATVTLVRRDPTPVPYATVEPVESAAEMAEAILAKTRDADGFVSAAAVGDFTVAPRDEKIRSGEPLTLELEPTEKILDRVRDAYPDLPVLGFKAETSSTTEELIAAARSLYRELDLALVVANDASVMGKDDSRVFLVDETSETELSGPKDAIAATIVERFASHLDDTRKAK